MKYDKKKLGTAKSILSHDKKKAAELLKGALADLDADIKTVSDENNRIYAGVVDGFNKGYDFSGEPKPIKDWPEGKLVINLQTARELLNLKKDPNITAKRIDTFIKLMNELEPALKKALQRR